LYGPKRAEPLRLKPFRQEETVSELSGTIDKYLRAWNETDSVARRKQLDEIWAEGAGYVDPLVQVTGRDGLDQVIAGAQGQFGGLQFERGTTYEEHHNMVRFTWHLVTGPGADPVAVGFDVVVLDGSGRIAAVYGFIDKMPGA
jgi:hypothetical protein